MTDLRGPDPEGAADEQPARTMNLQVATVRIEGAEQGAEGAPGELTIVARERYEQLGELARGGMGIVWRAIDRRAGRLVAIKELLSDEPDIRWRFEREARVTAQLQHPSIVPVYEVGCWPDGTPFYAMKLVEGRPLNTIVKQAEDSDARLALIPRILPAVEAIAYAHEQGVIHRDLKPSNVLLGAFGETIVIDWGLATGIYEGDASGASEAGDEAVWPEPGSKTGSPEDTSPSAKRLAAVSSGELTRAGAVMGTPAYMAPEQAGGEPLDARADVYALGALLYQTLSGRLPYEGSNPYAVITELATKPPEPLAKVAPNAPADLVAIVEKAMARHRADRYADAGELARELEAFSTGRLVATYQYTSWELLTRFVRRNRALSLAIFGLVAVIVIGAATVFRAYQISQRQRDRAVAAEAESVLGERTAHERLAQVHWQAAMRKLERDEHLEAEVLAAAALLEHPANPSSPYHALGGGDGLAPAARDERLAGPGASWAAARALRFATRSRELPAHDDWVYSVQPSADGRWVLTAGADRKVHIWDAEEGKQVSTLEGHTDTVYQALFRPDGKQLATTSYDGTVRLWSFPGASLQATMRHPSGRVYGACYAYNGMLLAAGLGGILAVFDPSEARLVAQVEVTHSLPGKLSCAARRPLAVLSTKGAEAVIIDVDELRVVRRLPHPGASVVGAELSADEAFITTAERQGIVRRFDRASGELLAEVRAADRIQSMISSADGRWLALADEVITILDGATLRPVARLTGHDETVQTVAFDATGRHLYSGAFDNRVIEWRLGRPGGSQLLLTPNTGETDSVVVSPDGRWLVSSGEDTAVRLWDLQTGRLKHTFSGHTAPPRGLVLLDDTHVASTGMDRTLWVYDLEALASEQVAELPHFGDELTLSPSGGQLAVGSGDGNVLLYDTATWAQQAVENVHTQRARWVGFAPSGERLASAGYDGDVALIDTEDGRVMRRWKAHATRINDAAWLPDGERLTTSDFSGWVRMWDVTTGQQLVEWRVLDGERIHSLAWAPDGSRLLLATAAGVRCYRPDGTLEARLDLAARTTSAGWTRDGRVIFAAVGKIFVLPLDAARWGQKPEILLKEAEQAAGVKLGELLEVGR